MATLRDLRRLALALPGTSASTEHIAYSVRVKAKDKGFAWAWRERIDPKKPRVENREVIAIRVASLSDKELLLASDPDKFFTEPHYNGYPAVLVRLAAVTANELEVLLAAAWRAQAPGELPRARPSGKSPGRRTPARRR